MSGSGVCTLGHVGWAVGGEPSWCARYLPKALHTGRHWLQHRTPLAGAWVHHSSCAIAAACVKGQLWGDAVRTPGEMQRRWATPNGINFSTAKSGCGAGYQADTWRRGADDPGPADQRGVEPLLPHAQPRQEEAEATGEGEGKGLGDRRQAGQGKGKGRERVGGGTGKGQVGEPWDLKRGGRLRIGLDPERQQVLWMQPTNSTSDRADA